MGRGEESCGGDSFSRRRAQAVGGGEPRLEN